MVVEFEQDQSSDFNEEEFKSAEGSLHGSFGEQGTQSPLASPKETRIDRVKKMQQ